MSKPSSLISTTVAAFAQSGVSITVAGRGDRLVPSISKAVGCRVDPDRLQLTVLLFADVAEAVCRDIAHNGRIAVCFSRPSIHDRNNTQPRVDAFLNLGSPNLKNLLRRRPE